MMNTSTKNAHPIGGSGGCLAIVCSLLMLLTGCGSPDSDDGEVQNAVELPTDVVLNLYCEDFGIFTETCVLDDPENPYRRVNVNNDNKFDLADAAPSRKARVYLWATALARNSTGENQVNVAKAMYSLSNESCSQLIQDQAQRAYRSVLDNYFGDVTFFSTDDFGAPFEEVFYPFPVKILAVDDLRLGVGSANPDCAALGYIEFMFDPDGARNDFLARVKLNEWGYLYDDVLADVTKL